MAIVETIPDVDAGPSRARQRRGKRGKRGAGAGGEIPLRQPSDTPAAAEGSGQKPLVDLTLDDLRAAGVTFSDQMPADVAAAAGVPGVGGGVLEEEEDVYDSEEEILDPQDDPDTPTDADRALEAWWDEVFDSMVYTIPFSFLFLLLDILSNNTYAVERSRMYYVKNYAFALGSESRVARRDGVHRPLSPPLLYPSTPLTAAIGVLVFYANRHMARSETCRLITTAVSIGASTRVIWLMNHASYLTVMAQGPAYGTIWICTIVMLPLGHALVALAAWYGFVWAKGLRINL